MSQYAALLKDPRAGLMAPASFLSGRAGFTKDSALLFLRSNPGFIGRNLPLHGARELSVAAGQAGFETALVPETELPALPPPIAAERVETKDDGFYALAAGARAFFPFESLKVISLAVWDAAALPDTLQALKPGLFARLAALAGAPVPPVPATPKETFFRADLICGEDPVRLVLKPEALDFSALGKARSPSSLANFRALLDMASAASFGALKGASLPAFLSGAPLAPHKVASPEAADLALTRLLLLSTSA